MNRTFPSHASFWKRILTLAGGLVLATAPLLAQANGNGNGNGTGGGAGQGPGNGTGLCPGTCVTAPQPLSEAEAASLAFMREEEKLARDLYRRLHAKWNVRAFDRIAESEQRHFDAIGRLLERHQQADPAAGNAEGVFKNQALQNLFNELLAKGGQSVKDALEVGVLVEKTDIADLEKALPTLTNTEVKRVYTSLLSGSMSHLDSFESLLEVVN